MGIKYHPSVISLEEGNYKSWRDGILKHCRWIHLLPHLYGLIPEPSSCWQKSVWESRNDHVLGLIGLSVGEHTSWALSHIECPRTLWTILWERYGDPTEPPFSDDPATDMLLSLEKDDDPMYDDDTEEELAYWKSLDCLDCKKTSPPDAPLSTSPTLEAIQSPPPTGLIEILASSNATSDSLQQVHSCLQDSVHWDEFLSDISFLFVESLISDLDDTIDCIHLLFDDGDSSPIVVKEHCDPLPYSLHYHSSQSDMSVDHLAQHLKEIYLPCEEIHEFFDRALHQFLNASRLSYSTLSDFLMTSFRINMETMEQFSKASYILKSLPTYSFQDLGDFIQAYLVLFLPKGRNVVRRSWTSFYIQFRASIIGYTLWKTTSPLVFHFLRDLLVVQDIVLL